MLINCSAPAINYSTCYHGEANVLMRGNGKVYGKAGFKSASLSSQHKVTKKHKCSNTESAPALLYTML